jgi:hypothetical protein
MTVNTVAPENPAIEEAIARLARAAERTDLKLKRERLTNAPGEEAFTAKGPRVMLLHEQGPAAARWSQTVGLEDWPRGDGYRIKPLPGDAGAAGLVVASRETRGLLYGCYALAEEIERQGKLPLGFEQRSEPRFASRGWSSLTEDVWCRWVGGTPQWYRNEYYLAYLRDAFSQAPVYRINTFQLMGRGNVGELHNFINYERWDRLAEHRSAEARRLAQQQSEVLEDLARYAQRYGVRLFIWDHELQFPRDFAEAYPLPMRGLPGHDRRGVGSADH